MSYGQIFLNGVNYSGSHVEPNPTIPSGAKVTPLSNVKVDEDYFSISGGGGGGGSSIKTFEKTITTTQFGWWWVTDENDNILDPTQHTLLNITPIVDYNSMGDVYYGGFFFEYDNNTFEPTIEKGYIFELGDLNNGGYIRQSMTIKVKVSYI